MKIVQEERRGGVEELSLAVFESDCLMILIGICNEEDVQDEG